MTTTEFAFESSTSTSDETPLATQPPPNDYFDETKRKTNDYQQNQWQNDNANNVARKLDRFLLKFPTFHTFRRHSQTNSVVGHASFRNVVIGSYYNGNGGVWRRTRRV